MKSVLFLKSGIHFGYGYSEGQLGIISDADFSKMEAAGIVRAAHNEELAEQGMSKPERAVSKEKKETR